MMYNKKYSGIVIPAITPLTADFKLDHYAVEKMLYNFRLYKANPFILGTTGESALLPLAVKYDYIKLAGRLKQPGDVLYAGISSNCLEESIDMARRCFDEGVDVVAATLPTYYALSEKGMRKYFEMLADKVQGPLIIYNIPATTHMSIPLKVIDDLSYHENIVGTKDSERSEERLKESLRLWANRSHFSHFLGWAAQSASALLQGSDGLIPSTGNLYPDIYREMYKAAALHNDKKAYQLQRLSDQLGAIYQAGRLLGESLAALKVLMHEVGLCLPYVMPPLQTLSKEEGVALRQSLNEIIIQEELNLQII